MDLGTSIKTIRKQKGITQNSFAEQCDITQAYLSQIENNLKEPNLATLKKISEGLDVPLPIIFFMALDNEDIKPEKKEAYRLLEPAFKSLLKQVIEEE